ncbi:uncharacterized protein EI97DRAFT_293892 [Westerdykella ornata]|uniref:Fanconi-associated nuclease n=1 Tax=Westerdykella ornata TaxID=318751 RepID=A0A6A6JRB5_WESOR|nr:uncharacterized protein EI97DRAFT_293892 [Westerdykella ornata]KAF2277499.1 hypothetical protein EI97DRAFT_293892 [Westerdykella ornata]
MIRQYFQRTKTTVTDAAAANPPPTKRRRLNDSSGPGLPNPATESRDGETAAESNGGDGEAEATGQEDGGVEGEEEEEVIAAKKTDLESALPAVARTDREAIEEYEAFKASQSDANDGFNDKEGRNGGSNTETRLQDRKWVPGKSSIYVDAFNLALDTVLEEESHLFDQAEREVFAVWMGLGYEAQYLYVRLFLRKTAAWHRIRNLGYHGDIADMEAAVETLQRRRELPSMSTGADIHPGETEVPAETTLGQTFTFADRSEEEITTLEEASSLLRLDELKALAKDAKVQGKNKKELLKALRRASQRQVGLGFVGLKRSDTESSRRSSASGMDVGTTTEVDDSWDTASEANRDGHFLRKIMAETGPCIRLSAAPFKLFERVHLVFYRSTEWTEKSLTTIILAKIARRNFPEYIVSRSANIFSSRSSLLEFEAAIRTQHRVDSILEFNGRPTEQGYQEVIDIFEAVYPRWHALVQEEQRKEETVYHSGEGAYLRRLSPAWVYTRIIHKAASVLARRKDHLREHELLTELLRQRLFHHSRRGAWYQRKALLEEHYMAALCTASTPTSPSRSIARKHHAQSLEAAKKHWKCVALQTCETGLQDNLVHLIHHYDLQKRITKLEKALRIPKRLQHDFNHVPLSKPVTVTVRGIRLERSDPPPPPAASRNAGISPLTHSNSTKTIWLDPADPELKTTCTVEEMCLSHYRSQGWKGYHSESGILRTLFAYLFHDILFTYVPNVFQTPYQTCPLDLHTDAFYPTRISEINARLNETSNGAAPQIVRRVWEREHERRTCIVGLDWGFEIRDLDEVVRCWEGGALATVCKVLAQEYGERGGGVPDLFLWRVREQEGFQGEGGGGKKGEVMFAEVKSENDRLSDTQRLWIHVLTGAGVRVELCHAVADEVRVIP